MYLSVTDSRNGKSYKVPISENNTVAATEFGKMQGLRVYDPSFNNTAVAKSSICYIDGDRGVLSYRGYSIEELAEKSSFLEVAYLLIYGDLPTTEQFKDWHTKVMTHTFLHEKHAELIGSFNYDSHPMGVFISSIAALSTFHPDANPSLNGNDLYKDASKMDKQIVRLLGKAPTIAAASFRTRIGRPLNAPQSHLSYTENLLYMMDHLAEEDYKPSPVLAKALDLLFILHADHELNCSTAAMRHISSSLVDPYSATAGAAAALYGPLHGGACEAVLRMLEEIGSVENIPKFLEKVKSKDAKLMGFGHRIYKNNDPRARLIAKAAHDVFAVCGREPLIDIAVALEAQALKDEYFISRKLYPNVDFYSGIIYRAIGLPTDMFPVLFAIPRIAGWLSHWKEAMADPNGKIWRPRQVYVGHHDRKYVPMAQRGGGSSKINIESRTGVAKRTGAASFKGKSKL